MASKKGRTVCSVRCSHCNDFGTFENYTKADGHYKGVFLCVECREKGVPFPGEESKEIKPKKKRKKKAAKKEVKKQTKLGITSLLNVSDNQPKNK